MKSDEKLLFCQIYAIVWGKMVHVVIDRYFSLFVKGLKIFLNPRLSLIVPLTGRSIFLHIKWKNMFFSLLFQNFSFEFTILWSHNRRCTYFWYTNLIFLRRRASRKQPWSKVAQNMSLGSRSISWESKITCQNGLIKIGSSQSDETILPNRQDLFIKRELAR